MTIQKASSYDIDNQYLEIVWVSFNIVLVVNACDKLKYGQKLLNLEITF